MTSERLHVMTSIAGLRLGIRTKESAHGRKKKKRKQTQWDFTDLES